MLSAWQAIGLEILLPGCAMLAAERLGLSILLASPSRVAWVRRQWFLHPNFITRLRYPMGLVTLAMFCWGWPRAALLFFGFWMITDLSDGEIARRCDLSTELGATIDPLSDKLMYGPWVVYFWWIGVLTGWVVAAFVVFDVIGQTSRWFLERKSANLFGKAKTFLVVLLIALVGVDMIYGPVPRIGRTIDPMMGFCAALALCSTAFKIIPNYWYANTLSLLNLVCGLAGMWVLLSGRPAVYAFGLVFLGQFLDLFDGRAAQRWGSTPRGELFDDIADGTSFGATVGVLLAKSFVNPWVGLAMGAVHLWATVYRLIRFVVEKRRDGVVGGVGTFSGLPSPAGALLCGASALLVRSDMALFAVVVAVAGLMVSRVPYPHFGRTVLARVPGMLQVAGLALFVGMLAMGFRQDEYEVAVGVAYAGAIGYALSPAIVRLRRLGESHAPVRRVSQEER